jgi:hypothetical protein
MTKSIALILLSAIAALAQAQPAGPVAVPTTDRCNAFAQSLMGKRYDDNVKACVDEQKFTARVVARDNARYAATMDYRPDRVNLQLEHNRITQASCG